MLKVLSATFVRSASIVLNYAILLLLSNRDGVEIYGYYSYYIAFIFTYSTVLKLGFDVLIMRESNEEVILDKIIPSFIMVSAPLLGLSFLVHFFFKLEWEILISSHAFAATLVLAELVRRKGGFLVYIIFTGVFFLLVQLMCFWWLDLMLMKLGILISYLLSLILLIAYLRFRQGVRISIGIKMIDRKTFQDAFHATVLGLSTSLNNQAAIFIFSLFASKEMVGIFSIAKRISNGAGLPVQILNVYNAPLFIKMRTGTEAFNTFIRKEMKDFFVYGFLGPLFFIPLVWLIPLVVEIPPELLSVFYTITVIFLLGTALNGLTGPTFTLIRIVGSLEKATKAQVFTYSILLVALLLQGYAGNLKILNINFAISSSFSISLALTALNLYYVHHLKKHHNITLLKSLPFLHKG